MEENPGPTKFDIIDPTTTVSADSSQGNEALFGVNAGKQCVVLSLTAIIYHQIQDISLWISLTLNNILVIGTHLYSSIGCSVRTNDYLLLTDVPDMVSIFDKVYSIQYSESFTGSLFMTSKSGPYMSLRNSLLEVFSNSQQNYTSCLLTVGINTVAVFKNFLRILSKASKFLILIQGICMGCQIHLGDVLWSALMGLKMLHHICKYLAHKQVLFHLK